MKLNMKLILCASVIIAAIIPPAIAFGFGFGNNRCNNSCNNAGISNSNYITVIDTSKLWSGQSIVRLYAIKGHEYIVVEAGAASGGTHIIHAESCPCKQK